MAFTIPNEVDAGDADQAEVDAQDFTIITSGNQFDGVITGCAVTFSANMTVNVAVGQVSVGGYFPFIASTNLTPTAPVSGNRFDLVTVDYNGAVTLTTGTASTTNPVFPAIPANSIILASLFVKSTDIALSAGRIIDKRIAIQNIFEQEMEFVQGLAFTTGNIGELGWGVLTTGTGVTPAAAQQTGIASHPGIMRIGVTSALSTDLQAILQGQGASDLPLLATSIARFRAIVRLPVVTNVLARIGFTLAATSTAGSSWGAAGAWFEYNVGGAADTWRGFTRNASVSTQSNITGTLVANNWYDLEMVRLQNGNWQFVVNKTIGATNTTNAPTVAGQFAIMVNNGTTIATVMDVDYIGYNLIPLGQRNT